MIARPSSRIVRIAPVSNPIELLSDDEPTWAEAKIKRPNPLARWVSRLCCRGCCACMCTAPDQGIWGNIWLIWLCGMWTSIPDRIASDWIELDWIGSVQVESNPIGSAMLSVSSLSCCCSWSCSFPFPFPFLNLFPFLFLFTLTFHSVPFQILGVVACSIFYSFTLSLSLYLFCTPPSQCWENQLFNNTLNYYFRLFS